MGRGVKPPSTSHTYIHKKKTSKTLVFFFTFQLVLIDRQTNGQMDQPTDMYSLLLSNVFENKKRIKPPVKRKGPTQQPVGVKIEVAGR